MMMPIFSFLNQYIKAKLLTSSVLGLSLLITPSALADYQPPDDPEPPSDYTGQGGSRDGCDGKGMPLTALVPLTHVGKTVSTRPTFAWFVPDNTRKSMELRLHEYDSEGTPQQMGEPILKDLSSPGIMTFTLPEDRPELKVGHTYLWQVSIICESSILIAEEDIKVVEKPSDWENTLSDRANLSDFYADEGLWYDALQEAIKLAEESGQGEVGSLLEELITSEETKINQQDLSEQDLKEKKRRIEDLREIANY
ncbi:MAG: DUF928 domain-containing protein [Symploca sp. SIO2D2]|nr:DUF928 domain-containing protein [Symploca sp. SIO2D2]